MQSRRPIITQFMIGTQAHALQVFNNAFRSGDDAFNRSPNIGEYVPIDFTKIYDDY